MAQRPNRKMLAIFVLSLLIFTQTIQASSSDDDRLDARSLSHLLDTECTQGPIDLGLIIESSNMFNQRAFKNILEFIANLLDEFDIGQGQNQTRVAAISFGSHVFRQEGFNFTAYSNKEQVKGQVLKMTSRRGESRKMGEALKYMRELQMEMRRPGIAQIEVVVASQKQVSGMVKEIEAMKTKLFNITVLAVGVKGPSWDEFSIAGDVTTHVFLASSPENLDEELKNNIKEKICTDAITTPPKECDHNPIDLGLIIDSSRSIKPGDFTKGLKFLVSFLDEFDIGQGINQTRVAAVLFGKGVYTEDGFNFTAHSNKLQVKLHVLDMTHKEGDNTDTDEALKYMRELQMEMRRSWAEQMEVVITDGNSSKTSDTVREAMETKKSNITVFAVGVGSVNDQELIKIAGDVEEHVFHVSSYNDLGEGLRHNLTRKTCRSVTTPSTTTVPSTPTTQPVTTPSTTTVPSTPTTQPTSCCVPALEACGLESPVDIIFVFSAATMGLEQICTVTLFISNVISHDELNEGFQYGVVSGDCSDDEGFKLNQYQNYEAIREHLERYNQNNLPHIVQRTTETWFSIENGARVNATKTAVIFLGNNKMYGKELGRAIERMLASDVRVFVSVSDCKILSAVALCLPSRVTLLIGDTFSQATQLVNHLCPRKFEEGNFPDCKYDYEGCARS